MSFIIHGLCQVIEPGIMKEYPTKDGKCFIVPVRSVDNWGKPIKWRLMFRVSNNMIKEFTEKCQLGRIVDIRGGEATFNKQTETEDGFFAINIYYHPGSCRILDLVRRSEEDE